MWPGSSAGATSASERTAKTSGGARAWGGLASRGRESIRSRPGGGLRLPAALRPRGRPLVVPGPPRRPVGDAAARRRCRARRGCSTRAAAPAATWPSSARLGTAAGVDPSPEAIAFCHRRGLDGVREAGVEAAPVRGRRVRPDPGHRRARAHRARRPRAPASCAASPRPARAADGDRARLQVAVEPARRLAPPPAPLHAAAAAPAPAPAPAGGRCCRRTSTRCCCRRSRRVRTLAARRREASDYELTEGPLNRVLELPMRAEAAAIGRGARFPAGVSIGMVCRPA